MRTFEQLNENILLNNNVVFTLNQLRDYVCGNEDIDWEKAFENDAQKIEYYGKHLDFCIDKWLDDEANFQSACAKCYDLTLSKVVFQSGNNTYPYAKEGIYNIQPATKSK